MDLKRDEINAIASALPSEFDGTNDEIRNFAEAAISDDDCEAIISVFYEFLGDNAYWDTQEHGW